MPVTAKTSSLSEEHRAKLDGIVSEMTKNKESDADIQFVVNDFKQKYGTAQDEVKKKEQSTGGTPSVSSDLSQLSGNIEQPQPTESTESESVITLPLIGQVRVGQNSAKFNLPGAGEVEVEKDVLTGDPVFKELPKSDPNKLPAHLQNSGAAYVQANVEKQQQEQVIAQKQKAVVLERKETKDIADFYEQNIDAAPGKTPEEKALYVAQQYKALKKPELAAYQQQKKSRTANLAEAEEITGININPIFRHKGEFKEEAQQLEYQDYADALKIKDIALKQRAENAAKLAGETYYDPADKTIKSKNIERYSKNVETINAIADSISQKEAAGQPPTPEELEAIQTALADNQTLESDGQFQQALAETQQFYADFDKNQQDAQQLINKFPELQKQLNYERIKRIADQQVLESYRKTPLGATLVAAQENFGAPIAKKVTEFADGLNGLPRTLKADNEYGITDALADLSTDMVEDVYAATPVSKEKDTRGELTWSNAVPKTVEMLAGMVPMVAGGYIGSAGKLAGTGSAVGTTATAFVQNNKAYYDEALAAGMTPKASGNFAILASGIQAALELVSPPGVANPVNLQKNVVKAYVNAVAKGVSAKEATKEAGRIMARTIYKENKQETGQLVADKLSKFAANELAGAQFEDTGITAKEFKETIVLTTIATILFSGAPIAKSGISGFSSYLERSALLEAASNPEYFNTAINERVAAGEFTPEEGKYLTETITDFSNKLAALPPDIKPETQATILALQHEKMKLEKANAQEGIDDVFKKRNAEKIKGINAEIEKLVPEQTEEVATADVLVNDDAPVTEVETTEQVETPPAVTETVEQTEELPAATPKIVAPVAPKQEEQPTPQRPKLDRRSREKELLKRKPKILSDQQKKETQLLDKFDTFNQLTASNRKSAAGQQKLQKIINEAESLGYTVKPNQFYQLSFEGQKPKRSASETKATLIEGYNKLTKREPDIQEKYSKIADAFHAQGDFFFKGVDLGDMNINDIEGAIFDIDNNIGSYRAQEFLNTIERFSKENDVPFFNGSGVSFDEFMRLASEPMTKEVSAITLEPGSDWEADLLAQGVTQDELKHITQFLYEEQQEERPTKKSSPEVEGGTGLGAETGSEQETESGGTVKPPKEPKKPRFEEPEEGEQKQRGFATSRLNDKGVGKEEKKAFIKRALNYIVRENAMTTKEAAAFVDEVGMDAAEDFVSDRSNGEPEATIVAVGQVLMKRISAKIRSAQTEEEKNQWAERWADIGESLAARITGFAQGTQMASAFSSTTPEGLLIAIQRGKTKAAKAVNEKYAAASQKTKEQFNEAVQKTAEKTAESPAVEKQLNSLVEKELQRREAAKKKTAEKLEELKKKFKDKGACK
jgi:hypothetical protein